MNRPFSTSFIVVILLSIHFVLALNSIRHKSNTFDELVHLTAGYTYWKFNDYRFNPENGNFPQRWAAVPLLLTDLKFPEADSNVWDVAHEFFFNSGNDGNAMLFRGRMMIASLSLLLGLGTYLWSCRIFGRFGGLISLALYCFSPSILAHGRLTTSDLAVSMFFILSVWSIWIVLHRINFWTVSGCCMAVSGLLLSKMSGVLIVPISIYLVFVKLLWGKHIPITFGGHCKIVSRYRQIAVVILVASIIVLICVSFLWGAYGFRFVASKNLQNEQNLTYCDWAEHLERIGWLKNPVLFLRDNQVLPEAYLYGLTSVISFSHSRYAFLLGQHSGSGWWYFFPLCFAVKTPLTTFLIIILAIWEIKRAKDRSLLYPLSPLICFFAVYLLVAMSSNINIGHRHILPVYPVLFIFAGATGRWYFYYKKKFKIFSLLIVPLLILETQWIHPHYLAFFNTAAGGPQNGYRLLVDSSLDWGQDLIGLKYWIEERKKAGDNDVPFQLAYFGTASPVYHEVPARIIPLRPLWWSKDVKKWADILRPGYYCVSATELQQVYGIHGQWDQNFEDAYQIALKNLVDEQKFITQNDPKIDWNFNQLQFARLSHYLKRREPDENIGYSILIYKVSADELKTALYGSIDDL